MSAQWTRTAVLATVLMIGGLALAEAQSTQTDQSTQKNSDTYTWNGELVSVDTTAMTMTVKSRVAYHEAISELKHFKPGDRVWIVWSGVQDSSDAVRQIRRFETGRKIDEHLVLLAELVGTEAPDSFITIRVKVPEGALAAVKAVKPGEWVTVTSRHRPSSDSDAVVTVRPWSQATTN
jgi:hypothetical protein